MPISLRIPPKQEEAIAKAAKKAGKTKTAFIIEAVNEKLGLIKNREQVVRKTAGWLGPEEASDLKAAVKEFEEIHEGDWP
jgi:predicted DNA-binding protein